MKQKVIRNILLATLFSAISVVLVGCNITSTSNPIQTPHPTSETEMYAQRFDIPIEEAGRRLDLQEEAGKLQVELNNKEAGTFVGLWIEHSPAFKIVVQFTLDGNDTIKPYLSPDLAAVVEVRTANYSYDDLQNAQTDIGSSLRSLDIPIDSAIDVKGNRVQIKIKYADRDKFDSAIREGKLKLPESVEVVWVPSLATPV
jgi:hypothetical protein